jgi:hypothetical protein
MPNYSYVVVSKYSKFGDIESIAKVFDDETKADEYLLSLNEKKKKLEIEKSKIIDESRQIANAELKEYIKNNPKPVIDYSSLTKPNYHNNPNFEKELFEYNTKKKIINKEHHKRIEEYNDKINSFFLNVFEEQKHILLTLWYRTTKTSLLDEYYAICKVEKGD